MSNRQQPQVLILPEGYTRTQKRDAQRNNIMAAKLVAETVRTTLGPKGMDKMLVDSMGDVVITNDGVTILKEMEIEHPAAKMIVEIAKTQEEEVGDGTTTAVIIAGALLKKAEELLDQEVHPTVIVRGYSMAGEKAIKVLDKLNLIIKPDDIESLIKLAKTCTNTKGAGESDKLVKILVTAVTRVVEEGKVDINNIKIQKKVGMSIDDSELVDGFIIDKERISNGMPRKVKDARIVLISNALEIEKTETEAKINISSPDQLQSFLDQEERMIKSMVDKIIESKASVVLCQRGMDDVAQHYLTKAGIMAIKNISSNDMNKLSRATGANVVKTLEDLSEKDLGSAKLVEEVKIGNDNMIFIRECSNPKAVSILIRGGTEHVIDEVERAMMDAIGVLKSAIEDCTIVPGGGATEMAISKELFKYAETLKSREQLAVRAFAEALESIPRTLAENAGIDPIDIIVGLKAAHDAGKNNYGVDVFKGEPADMLSQGVIEPSRVKKQAIQSATEVAIMILRIDDVIAAGKLKEGPGGMPPMGMGGMGGMPDMM
ncbi:MAG: thermosome subunit alpha [Candidatus Nanoarchaeia archaeon]|jgi:thermosome